MDYHNIPFDALLRAPINKFGAVLPAGNVEPAPDLNPDYYGVVIGVNLSTPEERADVLHVKTNQGYQLDDSLADYVIQALQSLHETRRIRHMVNATIEQHEKELHRSIHGTLDERVGQVLRFYENTATDHLTGVKVWRDDMIVALRALSMCVDMVGNASTHAEKGARLRGLSEVLESILQKLRDEEFDFLRSYHRWTVDIFRSDYPVRNLQARIHQLESENRQLAHQLDEVQPQRKAARDFLEQSLANGPRLSSELIADLAQNQQDNSYDDSDPFANE